MINGQTTNWARLLRPIDQHIAPFRATDWAASSSVPRTWVRSMTDLLMLMGKIKEKYP
jgi:hypothetical protein